MHAIAPSSADVGMMTAVNLVVIVVVALAFAYAVLAVMAALGLTSFSLLSRFRKRDREDTPEGGLDDLLSSDLRVHPEACTSTCAAGCDVAG
jgi:hypothetical protein